MKNNTMKRKMAFVLSVGMLLTSTCGSIPTYAASETSSTLEKPKAESPRTEGVLRTKGDNEEKSAIHSDWEIKTLNGDKIDLCQITKKTKFIPDNENSKVVRGQQEGYILYEPDTKTLTLKCIFVNGLDMKLPKEKMTIKLDRISILVNKEEGASIFTQGEPVNHEEVFGTYMDKKIKPEPNLDYGITIIGKAGADSLNLVSKKFPTTKAIATGGYIHVESGGIYSDSEEADSEMNARDYFKSGGLGFSSTSYKQTGGIVQLDNTVQTALQTYRFEMEGGKFTLFGDAGIVALEDFSVSGNSDFKPSFDNFGNVMVLGNVNYQGREGLIVFKLLDENTYENHVYGDGKMLKRSVDGNMTPARVGRYAIGLLGGGMQMKFSIEDDSTFTLLEEQGIQFNLYHKDRNTDREQKVALKDVFNNKGRFINNGTIDFTLEPMEKAALNAKIKEIIAYLKLEGKGLLRVRDKNRNLCVYKNDGTRVNAIAEDFNLDFNKDASDRKMAGIAWKKEDNGIYTLTLDNASIRASQSADRKIILPAEKAVKIKLMGNNEVYVPIVAGEKNGYTTRISVDVEGDGTLHLNQFIGESGAGGTVTIRDKAKVYSKGGANFSASGGMGATLNVGGEGTLLDIDTKDNPNENDIYLATVNIRDGAKVNIHGNKNRVGVFATSALNIEGSSELTTSGKYGAYVMGMLTIDENSSFTAKATQAAFVVVDKENNKKPSDVYDIPNLPYGTQVVQKPVEDGSNNVTFWLPCKSESAADAINIRGINSEPVEEITGAMGEIAIKKRVDISGFVANLEKNSYTYTGSEIKPEPTVKDGEKTLIKDKDYILRYKNNAIETTDTQKAQVVVTGIGDYKGEKVLTFDIKRPNSTVTFNSNGGTAVDAQSIVYNKTATKPKDPTKEGHTFKGWYLDEACTKEFNFTQEKITKDTTLYAKWEANELPKPTPVPTPIPKEPEKGYIKPSSSGKEIIVTPVVASVNKLEKNNLEFKDVGPKNWFYNSVLYVVNKKYMDGISASEFSPNMPTSRAMISQIIYNLEHRPETSKKHEFIDVAKGMWYEKSLDFTFDKDIIAGFPDKTFRGNNNITREEFVSVLYRYAKYKNYDLSSGMDMSSYKDFENVGDWAKESMKWSVKHNVIKGKTKDILSPKDQLSRAELATILENLDKTYNLNLIK